MTSVAYLLLDLDHKISVLPFGYKDVDSLRLLRRQPLARNLQTGRRGTAYSNILVQTLELGDYAYVGGVEWYSSGCDRQCVASVPMHVTYILDSVYIP